MKKLKQHRDKFNRDIKAGQLVCWATGWSRGPKIGRVVRVCDKRIRIEQKYNWRDNEMASYHVLQQPNRIIILDDTLDSTLLLEVLKNKI